MAIDWNLAAIIAAPIIALFVGAVLDRVLERKPKLITYLGHLSSFTLKGAAGSTTTINTHSLVLWNGGRRPAKNVRLGHNYLPSFQLNPSVSCTTVSLVSGGYEIVLPDLVPGEQVTVQYLYFPPVTWNLVNTYVKSDEGMATFITVLPSRQYPKWVVRLGRFLLLMGLIASAYLLILAGRAVVALLHR